MAIQEQLDNLKASWLEDPSWDIEDTEGFEDHKEELLAFRTKEEQCRSVQYRSRMEDYALELGCPGNIELAERFRSLERRLLALERILSDRSNS